jgi:hypothetical protein
VSSCIRFSTPADYLNCLRRLADAVVIHPNPPSLAAVGTLTVVARDGLCLGAAALASMNEHQNGAADLLRRTREHIATYMVHMHAIAMRNNHICLGGVRRVLSWGGLGSRPCRIHVRSNQGLEWPDWRGIVVICFGRLVTLC